MTLRHLFIITAVMMCTLTPSSSAQKINIAVMNLKNATGVTADDAALLSDRLRIDLFNTNVFSVMERSQMQEILKERGFQMSGACTDQDCMVKMGEILGVQQLIGGSIGRLGKIYLINLRRIDISTGQVVSVVSEDIPGKIEKVVKAIPGIASRIAGLSASAAPEPTPPEADAAEQPPETEEQPPTSTPPQPPAPTAEPVEPIECDEKVYLEKPSWTAAELQFSLSAEEMAELNEEVAEHIEEGLDVCLFDDVEAITSEQLATLPACNALIIRPVLDQYTTEPGSREQVKGTATVSFYFYKGTTARQPYHSIQLSATGSQHWDEYQPFLNAFEEMNEEIQDQDFEGYMKELRSYIRKL